MLIYKGGQEGIASSGYPREGERSTRGASHGIQGPKASVQCKLRAPRIDTDPASIQSSIEASPPTPLECCQGPWGSIAAGRGGVRLCHFHGNGLGRRPRLPRRDSLVLGCSLAVLLCALFGWAFRPTRPRHSGHTHPTQKHPGGRVDAVVITTSPPRRQPIASPSHGIVVVGYARCWGDQRQQRRQPGQGRGQGQWQQ